MAVEVILLEDVEGLGELGDQTNVAEGYARNYLLPKKLAARISPASLQLLETKKLQLQKECQERLSVAQTLAGKLTSMSITIPVEASETDKLYGSVASRHIADALKEEGIEIQNEAIMLEEPIRELGVYTIDINLHADVQAPLKVWVVRA